MVTKTKRFLTVLTLLLVFPISVYATPSKVIPGGENIGIQINTKGVIISGLYQVDNKFPGKEAGLREGDIIVSINDTDVLKLSDMVAEVNRCKDKKLAIKYKRNGVIKNTTLEVLEKDGVYVTGLYVKDSIMGVGTLTFIDPETSRYGALGHEIIESYSGEKLEVRDGKIFKSEVTGVEKSEAGKPGEKQAKFDTEVEYGTINSNTVSGIFGDYEKIPNKEEITVGSKEDIKLDEATIYSTLSGEEVKEYKIKVIEVYGDVKDNKNFMFEIIDEKLLSLTGGVIQGMSGSPVIQNEKLIGAVTHVIVDHPERGYGVFIENMLEEAENSN